MPEPMPAAPDRYNLFDPAIIPDPYPLYHRLLAEDPVRWDESAGLWMLTRYADIQPLLRDARLGAERMSSPEHLEAIGMGGFAPLFGVLNNMMVFADPPRHTRLRGLVNRAFTPRRMEGMRAHIQQIVDELLDAVQPAGHMDVIRDLAYPLPTIVIAEMLGVPVEDRARFKQWSDDFAVFLGGFNPTPEQQQQALVSILALKEYFRGLVPALRRSPRNDLLSALATAEEQGDMLSEEELLANCILLLVAGHETTTNLIGNGVLALLRHPDQLHRLRADSTLTEGAVEELLRYESPVQGTGRVARAALDVDGRRIEPGQFVLLLMGAAHRDPAQFPDPDRLDVTRAEVRHLAFGHGPHFCLGAPLARIEGQLALATLLRRMPGLQLETETVAWREQFVLRGLKSLPVSF
jgi:cytochrome P450